MAIRLQDKANTIAPNGTYEFGDIKDNTGSNNGTAVNRINHADFHQFFAKIMSDAGITYNGLPDNTTNDYQYWLALKEIVKKYSGDYADVSSGITAGSGISISSLTAREYRNGTIMIAAILSFTSNIAANTNILSGIPNAFSNSFKGYTSFSTTHVEVGLYAAASHISNPYAVISALGSPTQFAFYVEYKKV